MTPPATIFVVIISASLTVGAAALLVLTPVAVRYQTALSNQAQWTADSNSRQQQALKVAQQAASLADVRPQVVGLLPASALQYDLVVQIEGLGRTLALPLTSLSVTGTSAAAAGAPKSTAAAVGSAFVALSVGATGTYAQALSLVQALPTISRSLMIKQVVISGAATSKELANTAGLVSVLITANAYYQPSAAQK